ncbi:helix-turn-helix domain-containing protein [Saccharopolyspora griseoalba]|uniref:Helix-turn-helix domain-containing protein n=1 Tax=Saccharopolyspora griseoalba TaxID=1431848 RepID=A0ABW2LS45_9PSEU
MADTPRARALAKELRAARNAKGLALREVARALGWSVAKLSRIETAKRGVRPNDLEALLGVLEVEGEDRDRLLKMACEVQEPVWWGFGRDVSHMLKGIIDAEQRAKRITHVSLNLVPGLLQTRNYTRQIMEAGGVEEPVLEERVAARQARQGVLTKRDPVEFHTFMDEAVFARAVGGPHVMAEQLRQVALVAETENVILRVLPRNLGAHAALSGGFVLFEFVRSRPVIFLEGPGSGAFVDEPEDVEPFLETAKLLDKQASAAEASRAILNSYVQLYESEAA